MRPCLSVPYIVPQPCRPLAARGPYLTVLTSYSFYINVPPIAQAGRFAVTSKEQRSRRSFVALPVHAPPQTGLVTDFLYLLVATCLCLGAQALPRDIGGDQGGCTLAPMPRARANHTPCPFNIADTRRAASVQTAIQPWCRPRMHEVLPPEPLMRVETREMEVEGLGWRFAF